MLPTWKYATVALSTLACSVATAVLARPHHSRTSHVFNAAAAKAASPADGHAVPAAASIVQVSPTWPEYDEIKLVTSRGLMTPVQGGFQPGNPLLAGDFVDALKRLRADAIHHGVTGLPVAPVAANQTAPLTREEAVDLLVRTMVPAGVQPTWSDDTVTDAVLDAASVSPQFKNSVMLAAERLYLPNPLRPTDAADRAFAAQILARALPVPQAPQKSPLSDDIQKALDLHIIYSSGPPDDSRTVTTAEMARMLQRARMYLPHDNWPMLPLPPIDSADPRPISRIRAIQMAANGLVADSRLAARGAGVTLVDYDARVVYAMGLDLYLSYFADGDTIPQPMKGACAVATYKGWIPNLGAEKGQLHPTSPASLGYVANLLARAVTRPGDYSGVVLDLSHLKPLERSGGMWVITAGDDVDHPAAAQQIYPSSHLPVRAFFMAPGALAYYGDLGSAEQGRAGSHPLVIQPLTWAQMDWSNMHGDPGLRYGGNVKIPLDTFHFVHGTPPLILITSDDAKKMKQEDHTNLLLRTARIALVSPSFALH